MMSALQPIQKDLREEPRASLYLAASLYCDGQSVPVKIRNLSTMGALLDVSAPVSASGLVQLVRGPLIVHALVAWSEGHRCGLKFSGVVDVQRWRMVPANAEQQRVDDIVRIVKTAAVPFPSQAEEESELKEDRPFSADLKLAAQLLARLGDRLAGDDAVVASHGPDLQNLDIAMQMIGAVEAMLSGQSDLATDATKIISLRRSADQVLGSAAS